MNFSNNCMKSHLSSRHAGHAGVLRADDRLGGVKLELLQRHDLLFQCVAGYQPVDVHHAGLPDPVGAVHRLQVLAGVPVVLHEDHRVRPREVEPQPAHAVHHSVM